MTKARHTTTQFSAGSARRAVDVLVVDDDASVRESALEILALAGILAAGAGNGAEALRFLTTEHTDLILLDLRMPVLDGWAFLRHRATSRSLSEIPVLVLSGEPQDASLHSFVAGWLIKPFGEDELVNAVTSQLRRIHHLPASTLPRHPTPTAVMRKP
jgi:CheY-like chemotaxis protein